MNLRTLIALTLCIVCAINQRAKAQPDKQPDLVVVIAVDQMRQDFFDRFGEHFTGGLLRLMEDGVMFTNAHHEHGLTNTAPGHAAISTGKYPSNNGIINNSFYDKEIHAEVYCVGDQYESLIGVPNDGNVPSRSPRNLKSTTIGDWLKKQNSKSRVFSVARKDRAAVLLGGQKADGAYWFDNVSTKFVTSTYYTKDYPKWADAMVGTEFMEEELVSGWDKYGPEEIYASLRPDDYEVEAGAFYADFPHTRVRMRQGIPRSSRNAIMLTTTPMGDEFVIKFAELLVEKENLGKSGNTDMLMVGCSAADAIGHHFGPESHEVMDYYLRLDQYLDEFLSFLDSRYGRDGYWVVLVSDHGVNPMPEALKARGIDAERILTTGVGAVLDSIEDIAREKLGMQGRIIEKVMGGMYLNYLESDQRGISRKIVRQTMAELIKTLPYVEDTYTVDDFGSNSPKPYAELFERSYYNGITADVMYRLKENYMLHGPYGTSHGSVYDYDTHVPILFSIPGIAHTKIDRRVATVDVAPTLAALLQIKADKRVDGQVLYELVKPQ